MIHTYKTKHHRNHKSYGSAALPQIFLLPIWFSNLLTLSVPDKSDSRNETLDIYVFIIKL